MSRSMRRRMALTGIPSLLLEQIRTIDKQRLTDKITHLDDETMRKVDEALQISVGLIDF